MGRQKIRVVNNVWISNFMDTQFCEYSNQRTNGPVNAHLISWPTKAQNIQNLENKW